MHKEFSYFIKKVKTMLIEVRKVRILFKSHPLYLHCRKEEREATMIGKTKRHSVLFLVLVLIVLSGCGKTAAADLSPQAKPLPEHGKA